MAFLTTASGSLGSLSPSATPLQRLGVAYSKKALQSLQEILPEAFLQYSTPHQVNQHSGKDVIITLTPHLTVQTTPLGEGQTAKQTGFTTTNAKMTLEWYGNDISFSKTLKITSMFIEEELYSPEMTANCIETLAQLTADDLDALTPTAYAYGTFARLTTAMRTLKGRGVRGFAKLKGMYCGIIGPYYMEDLMIEGGPTYAAHYYTMSGSDVLAEGMLSKGINGIQLHISTLNKSLASEESAYFFGEGALAHVGLKAGVAGVDGTPINIPGMDNSATIVHYVIPAEARGGPNGDVYGLYNHFVWLAGMYDTCIPDSNRVVTQKISEA